IGTTSPAATLEVTDNVAWKTTIEGENTNDDSSPAYLSLAKRPVSGATTMAANDYIGGVVMKGYDSAGNSQNYIEMWGVALDPTSGSEDSKINIGTWGAGTEYPNTLVANGGNVGIGTGSPAVDLHIYDNDAATSGQLRIEQDSTGDAGLAFTLTGEEWWSISVDNDDGNKLKIGDDDVAGAETIMTIDPSGLVGIGTASPDTKLHVVSTASGVSANAIADELLIDNSADTGITIASGTSSQGSILFADTGDNAIGRIRYDHANNDLSFGTAGVADRLVIDSDGDVGIGTNVPGTILHVNGSNQPQVNISSTNSDTALRIHTISGGQARLEFFEVGSTGWSIGERGA
ncbi:MAG: hypothetical protein QF535_03615, partial [Anaerolineales bacterium]|nr:hypothetical protein [Anaerolineales bacterium]